MILARISPSVDTLTGGVRVNQLLGIDGGRGKDEDCSFLHRGTRGQTQTKNFPASCENHLIIFRLEIRQRRRGRETAQVNPNRSSLSFYNIPCNDNKMTLHNVVGWLAPVAREGVQPGSPESGVVGHDSPSARSLEEWEHAEKYSRLSRGEPNIILSLPFLTELSHSIIVRLGRGARRKG
ncbi:hypothetical protein BJV77DRAFT_965078 [Russula vinacea]|nr:hypothetical protein BJV77DRAFT_965078 [Russula vinacea]